MMGYDAKAVQAIYGSDLLTASTAPFAFNYQFNARLGRAPSWKEIRLDEIAYPPDSDFRPVPVGQRGQAIAARPASPAVPATGTK